MGHGDDESKYGFGNYHAHDDFRNLPDATEQIYGDDFDKLMEDILCNVPAQDDGFTIILEQCNADNLVTAALKDMSKSFLERLSAEYPHITISGTGPWSDSTNKQESLDTGARSSGGYPDLNAPVTSKGGGIWKHGNTLIFHHHGDQIAVRKSPFASTETAKSLKLNTIDYAREILNQQEQLTDKERQAILAKICANRKILKIDDFKHEPGFPKLAKPANEKAKNSVELEKKILKQEQYAYLQRVEQILLKKAYSNRDVLIVALGLNLPSIFNGCEKIREKILNNKDLLKLVMVSCGKVLIADQNNNNVIDLLLENKIPIDSVDEKGMTALHYAVQNFFVCRREQLDLVNKLLDNGANPESKDNKDQTPKMLSDEHSQKSTVIGGKNVVALLQKRATDKHSVNTNTTELPKWQSILIEQIISGLERNYVFPEKIDRSSLMSGLTKRFSETFSWHEYASEYGDFNKDEFAKSVSQLLGEIVNDPHLSIRYDPKTIKENLACLNESLIFPWSLPPEDPRSCPEAIKIEHGKDLELRGCGFYNRDTEEKYLFPQISEQVKADKNINIPSSIGYIGLQFMADPKMFSVVAKKAFQVMQGMQDKDAIIIDLRGNTGGSPEGPRHYLSFFFKEKTHLNTVKTRKAGAWEEVQYHTYTGNEVHPEGELNDRPTPDLSNIPVYVLTDKRTFSAGEELAYDLQQQKRATIVGESTTGGAHPYKTQPLITEEPESKGEINRHFVIVVPNATSINPISKTNWEDGSDDKGVQPDVRVPAENALQMAISSIQLKKLNATANSAQKVDPALLTQKKSQSGLSTNAQLCSKLGVTKTSKIVLDCEQDKLKSKKSTDEIDRTKKPEVSTTPEVDRSVTTTNSATKPSK